MTTITGKLNKQELANFLEEVLADDKYVLQDKSLVDMVKYTLKKFTEDAKQVLKADLLDVATELSEYIAPKQVLLPIETKIKAVEKEENEATSTIKKELEEPTSDSKEPKKTIKKTKKTVKPVKEEEVKLPEVLDLEIGKYSLVTEGIDNLKELEKAIQDGRELVLAVYWSKKLLKQFQYGSSNEYADIKEFPEDFDIYQPIYFMDDMKSLYALSTYTEYMATWTDNDFDQVEGVRYINQAEYGIYENLEVDIEEILNEEQDIDEETVKELEAEEALLEEIEEETKKAKKKIAKK